HDLPWTEHGRSRIDQWETRQDHRPRREEDLRVQGHEDHLHRREGERRPVSGCSEGDCPRAPSDSGRLVAMEPFQYHVYVCDQEKPEGVPCCTARGSCGMIEELRREVVAQGLANDVHITT